jgi:hypothetical protein
LILHTWPARLVTNTKSKSSWPIQSISSLLGYSRIPETYTKHLMYARSIGRSPLRSIDWMSSPRLFRTGSAATQQTGEGEPLEWFHRHSNTSRVAPSIPWRVLACTHGSTIGPWKLFKGEIRLRNTIHRITFFEKQRFSPPGQ